MPAIPVGRRWVAAGLALAAAGACAAGCSNLEVKKVPVSERVVNQDHQEGFRYYLNRPYLVVKKPILITETFSLVKVDPVRAAPNNAPKPTPGASGAIDAGQTRLTFLDGPRRGQSVRLADLRVETPASGEPRSVSPAELQRMGAALASGLSRPPAADAPARSDPQVVPAQYQIGASDRDTSVSISGADGALSDLGAGGTAGAALATTDASTQTLVEPAAPPNPAALTGDMQIIYLPDLDEQYSIKSCNVFAKSSFGLAFKNGGELVEVDGEHDATTLAVSILQAIQSAIGTAQGVEQARIQREAKTLQAAPPAKGGAAKADLNVANAAVSGQQPVWQLVERTSIKPGVYRLNKPWEVADGPGVHSVGCGLLAKLGLPTVVDVDFRPVGAIK